ncbi:MAG: Pr6Pr family membrane protein [Chitinophagaceae bacterium]
MSSRYYITLIALLAWAGLIIQQYLLLAGIPGNGLTPLQAVGRFLLFFTILSNLLVAISCTIQALKTGGAAGRFFAKNSTQTAICLYILVVGLVYNIILRALWKPAGLQLIADNLLHVIVPAAFFLFWLLQVKGKGLSWQQIPGWLIYPALYLCYALLRGKLEGLYAYPFIDPQLHSWSQVGINSLGMLLLFVLLGAALIAIKKWQGRKAAA